MNTQARNIFPLTTYLFAVTYLISYMINVNIENLSYISFIERHTDALMSG